MIVLVLLIVVYLIATWKMQCRKNRLLNLPKELDIINLGSTYAYYDFSYQGTNLAGGNLANVPQYLDMDSLLLRKYIKKLKNNGKVLIVLPDFVFASEDCNYNRKVYYESLHFWEIKQFSLKKWLQCVWKAAKEPFTHSYRLADEKWKGYKAARKEKEQHAKRRIADWEDKIGIPNVKTNVITDELCNRIENNKKRVCDMIDFCREKNIEPILIIPPVSGLMHKEVADECLEVYLKSPVGQIVKEKKVRLYDYMLREELYDESLYMNSDCLNEEGKKFFMKILLQDIYNDET